MIKITNIIIYTLMISPIIYYIIKLYETKLKYLITFTLNTIIIKSQMIYLKS